MTASTPFDELYQRPGFLLRRAHQISVAIFERECAAVGLTPAQYGVLYTLSHAPDIGQSALSRALGLDRVTVLHVAKGLEKRGLIVRKSGIDGKRRLALALTAEGDRAFRMAQECAERALQALVSPFTEGEAQTLNALLNKLCATLESEARTEMSPPAKS